MAIQVIERNKVLAELRTFGYQKKNGGRVMLNEAKGWLRLIQNNLAFGSDASPILLCIIIVSFIITAHMFF